MAAQCDTLSGYLLQQQSDQGSNSERSTDSPLPGSEEDLSGPHPLPDPEWTEERFRVDRKKLEIMLLGKQLRQGPAPSWSPPDIPCAMSRQLTQTYLFV
ncbi:Protein bicaudal C 1-A [Goodea atripinnis]|uniref:Protein bicaudal C 1-A n=1 Tax=Goodea atripinnis TaxID=208336 RepID=A0ABV0N8R9_9TELE